MTCASATIPLLTRPAPCSPRAAGAIHGGSNHFAVRTTGGVKTAGRRLGGGGSSSGSVSGSGGGAGARFFGGGRGGAAGGARGARGKRRQQGYDIVVLDECSQIVEPMSLLPIAVAQPLRLVLVGDPMQLPPPMAHAKVRLRFGRFDLIWFDLSQDGLSGAGCDAKKCPDHRTGRWEVLDVFARRELSTVAGFWCVITSGGACRPCASKCDSSMRLKFPCKAEKNIN